MFARIAALLQTRDHSFPMVRRGYAPEAVDAFVREVKAQIAAGAVPDVDRLLDTSFPVSNPGYDRAEVQRHLELLAIEADPGRIAPEPPLLELTSG